MSKCDASNPSPGYCMRFVCFLCLFSAITIGCSSLEAYRLPENIDEIATIEDKEPQIGSLNYFYVMSIDRKRIDSRSRGIPSSRLGKNLRALGDPEDWIPLRVGLRKLEVIVCKYSPDVLDLLSFSGWHCGHAVLPLVVESGVHYRLGGSVNKQEDYAELWIEDANSGRTVLDVTRVPIVN